MRLLEVFSALQLDISDLFAICSFLLHESPKEVLGIFYGYYNIGATDPTTIGVERVEFVDATDDEGNPVTGFKLTDNATGTQYLVTDEWAPLQLVSNAPEAE